MLFLSENHLSEVKSLISQCKMLYHFHKTLVAAQQKQHESFRVSAIYQPQKGTSIEFLYPSNGSDTCNNYLRRGCIFNVLSMKNIFHWNISKRHNKSKLNCFHPTIYVTRIYVTVHDEVITLMLGELIPYPKFPRAKQRCVSVANSPLHHFKAHL